MTEKSHLTKSRNVSTKFQSQPFNIAGLYKLVCPRQLMKMSMLAVVSAALRFVSRTQKQAVKLICYLNIYTKAKKKHKNNTQLSFQLLDIKGRNTWSVRGHLKTTRIQVCDMYCMFEYLCRPMAVRSHCFEVYFACRCRHGLHTLPHLS